MTVDSSDSVDIEYLSWSSREVLCRERWWQQWRSFWELKCSRTSMLNELPGCIDDLVHVRNVSHSGHLLVLSLGFFWVARRFWLTCLISKKSWTLAILCNFLSSASFFISQLFAMLIVSNSGSALARIRLLALANCLTTTFLRWLPPVVFNCLEPIKFWTQEKLASTPTPSGMIENMSRTTLARSAYLECFSFYWRHQSVMSVEQHELLISIGSTW